MWEAAAGAPILRAESPGFALVEGETVVTGASAREALRLSPKRVSSRYWSQLDTVPLPRPFPDDLSHADLAHAQLAALWDDAARAGGVMGEVLLAVPASFAADQLALLLGIARACGMPVSGLVDSALAAASQAGTSGVEEERSLRGRLLHVDLELHRAVLTELTVQGGNLIRTGAEVIAGVGLQQLHDAWLRYVAGQFVRRTRFDPLHAAASEQDLDGRLVRALGELVGQETVTLSAEAGGRTVNIELQRAELATTVEDDIRALAAAVARRAGGATVTLLLSHRLACLPGLAAPLAAAASGCHVPLPAEAAGRGVLAAADCIRHAGEALPLVTRLPVSP